MRVLDVRWGTHEVTAAIDDGRARETLRYACAGLRLEPQHDTFLTASLILAMRLGGELEIAGPVSARLLGATDRIQAMLRTWYRGLRPVTVIARTGGPAPRPGRRAAAFFSGGVDSAYLLACEHDQIDVLVAVHGWERPGVGDGRERAARLRSVAAAFGKDAVEVETNVRDVSRARARWAALYHGAALASVGHLLGGDVRRVLIGGTHTRSDRGWGSHPELDPLWSSERVEIVHHAAGTDRVTKVAALGEHPVLLENLQVCTEDTGANCGRCGKCLRTAISLRLAGMLERCPTLPPEIDFDAVARLRPDTWSMISLHEDNLRVAQAIGDHEVARALRAALAAPPRPRRFVPRWLRHRPRAGGVAWDELAP